MEILQELLGAVRNIRSEYKVAPSAEIEVRVRSVDEALRKAIKAEGVGARKLGGIAQLTLDAEAAAGGAGAGAGAEAGATAVLTSGAEVFVPLEGLVDLARERERLDKQAAELAELVERSESRLAQDNFVRKAPQHVVEREREKLQGWQQQLQKVTEKRRVLESG